MPQLLFLTADFRAKYQSVKATPYILICPISTADVNVAVRRRGLDVRKCDCARVRAEGSACADDKFPRNNYSPSTG